MEDTIKMLDLIKLSEVICDSRASDGTWCKLPYENHPRGCPNTSKGCIPQADFDFINRPHKNALETHICRYQWYAVIEEFDLKFHAEKMRIKHPTWSERQCRNPLYWQGWVNARLKVKAHKYLNQLAVHPENGIHFEWACHILEVPEAHGINIFATMEKAGIILEKSHPNIVHKIMLLGIQYLEPISKEIDEKGYFEKVRDFHIKFGFLANEKPMLIPKEIADNRRAWLTEEINELEEAEKNGDIVEIADALGDILYLTFGTAVSYGIPIDSVFNEIHRSNMTKLSSNSGGKIKAVKGSDYESPDLTFILKQKKG